MKEISEIEIKSMTKEQNYMRGYEDGKSDALDELRAEIESQREEVSKKHSENDELQNYYYGLNDGLKDARSTNTRQNVR